MAVGRRLAADLASPKFFATRSQNRRALPGLTNKLGSPGPKSSAKPSSNSLAPTARNRPAVSSARAVAKTATVSYLAAGPPYIIYTAAMFVPFSVLMSPVVGTTIPVIPHAFCKAAAKSVLLMPSVTRTPSLSSLKVSIPFLTIDRASDVVQLSTTSRRGLWAAGRF